MLTATLYVFDKKINSTKQPTDSSPHLSVQLNINDDNSSVLSPAVRIVVPGAVANLYQYNYIHIPSMFRYYWINDWAYNADGTWTAYTKVDVLASWKTDIMNSNGYITREYDFGDQQEMQLLDPLQPPLQQDFFVIHEQYPTEMSADINNGTFVIGVVSDNAPNIGAVSYYFINKTNLTNLVQNMISHGPTAWSDIDSMNGDVLKSLVNPIQFIVSCKWFPFTLSNFNPGPSEQIRLWGWATGAYGYKMSSTHFQIPQANENWHLILRNPSVIFPGGDWTFYEYPYQPPYADYQLITPWGTFELDPHIMCNIYNASSANRHLDYRIHVNWVSGTGTLIVEGNYQYPDKPQQTYEFLRQEIQLALDIPLSQVSYDYIGIAKTGVSIAGKAFDYKSWALNGVQHGTSIVQDSLDMIDKTLSPASQSTSGATAAFTPLIEHIIYQARFRRKTPKLGSFGWPAKHAVYPLGQYTTYGYCVMPEIELISNCTEGEKTEIMRLVAEGFYIE